MHAMKAIAIDSQRQLFELELDRPIPGPRDLLVRVRAVAVNPIDTKQRAALKPVDAPKVLGWDAAGMVEATGASVTEFRPGDAVYYAGEIGRPGCNAQWQLVDARLAARTPASLSFAQAAALPLTSLTAWESLFERLGIVQDFAVNKGRRLLVIGGAGGVGSMAIQLAKRLAGLEVVATASRPESIAWCLGLGADRCVSHAGDLVSNLKAAGVPTVDYILNCHSVDGYWLAMAEAIKPQGAVCCLVSAAAPLDVNVFKSKSVTFAWEFMFTRALFQTEDMAAQGAILRHVAELVDGGILRTTLTECLGPLTVASLASTHAHIEGGHTVGKLTLEGMADS